MRKEGNVRVVAWIDTVVAWVDDVKAMVNVIVVCFRALNHFGALPNVPFPTMGGKVFWNNIFEREGWKVQKNMFTRHCRVLDPKNIRRAWGYSEGGLLRRLQELVDISHGNA